MIRWMLLALAALGGLMVPALAQPGDSKTGDKAEKFPAPPKGSMHAATASTTASWRRSSTIRRR